MRVISATHDYMSTAWAGPSNPIIPLVLTQLCKKKQCMRQTWIPPISKAGGEVKFFRSVLSVGNT